MPALAATLAGAVAAGLAIAHDHERGGLVFIPLIAGLYLAVLLVGEFAAPH